MHTLADNFFRFAGYKSLRRLRKLEVLVLSSNVFNNSILPYLTSATSLTTLFLRGNQMDGSFPMKGLDFNFWEDVNCTTVHVLFSFLLLLSWGSFPELKDLTNLEFLDLSRNMFNGSIPAKGSIYVTCFCPSTKLSWSCVSLFLCVVFSCGRVS